MQFQPTLFDASIEERELLTDFDGISGLTYLRGFLSPSEQERILDEVRSRPWLQDLKREVQHYGYKYDYKSRAIDASMYVGKLPEFALGLARRLLSEHLIEQLPDQMIVNKYEPGQGIALHVDCEPCFANTIITISLGSDYAMDFVNIEARELKKKIRLHVGSALILRDDARSRWMHGIKPRLNEDWGPRGTRISLTFRNVLIPSATPVPIANTAVKHLGPMVVRTARE